MSTVHIEPRKVAGVVIEASRILADKGFNRGEMILGLSELIGRVIIDTASSDMQAKELADVSASHINRTVQIGVEATQKRIVTGV
jgi:hypothetical protein